PPHHPPADPPTSMMIKLPTLTLGRPIMELRTACCSDYGINRREGVYPPHRPPLGGCQIFSLLFIFLPILSLCLILPAVPSQLPLLPSPPFLFGNIFLQILNLNIFWS